MHSIIRFDKNYHIKKHKAYPSKFRNLICLLATAPDENKSPLICRHFPLKSRQAIQRLIDKEFSKIDSGVIRKAVEIRPPVGGRA